MAPLGDTVERGQGPPAVLRWDARSSASGDYAAAVAMFDQARALAEQVGNERALADVLHMQTVHHLGYAEFADGIRVGLQAAETFERESALWDLCSVQAFVIYEDGIARQSRAGGRGSPTRRWASPSGSATIGAAFLVLTDRIRRGGNARRPAARWRRSVRRFWISVSGAGCRGATWATSIWAWPRTGEGDAERAEAELRNAVELEPPGRVRWAERLATGAAPGLPGPRRRGDGTLRVGAVAVEAAQPRPGQRHRLVELHARLR